MDVASGEEHLARLAEHGEDHLVVLRETADGGSEIVWSSPNRARVLGGEPEGDVAAAIFARLTPADGQALRAAAALAFAGTAAEVELRFEGFDGRERWLWIRLLPHPDGSVRQADMVVSDVTERRRRDDALATATDRYRALARSHPGAVLVFDDELRHVLVDGRAASALGLRPQLAGHGPEGLPTLLREALEPRYRAALEGVTSEVELRVTDHVWRFVVLPLDGDVPAQRGGLALAENVTGRKHAELVRELMLVGEQSARSAAERERQALVEQNRRLRELDRAKDTFLASVSHELRTPLTSIRGYLELLIAGDAGELPPDAQRFLGVLDRNAGRLERLVTDLLLVAQAQSGRLRLERHDLDLAGLVADCVEAAAPTASAADIRLESTLGSGLAIAADRSRLGQVLDNLIGNAIGCAPAGTTVSVATGGDGSSAWAEVRNEGTPIRPEDLDHLFEPFFRTSEAAERAHQGLGLGLAIARALAEAHGGWISVVSDEHYTRFRLLVPRGAASLRAAA
jgi:signal transduction histidine kinase